MAPAPPRPPPTVEALRRKSEAALANFRPDEYSIRSWANTARVAFETAARCWAEGRQSGDRRKVEEAFLEYRKAAGQREAKLG
ncbi:hypothetical protein JCM8097_007816 [Rhodosporidiobolus ruineniae]